MRVFTFDVEFEVREGGLLRFLLAAGVVEG
jgi:hypothetical protein